MRTDLSMSLEAVGAALVDARAAVERHETGDGDAGKHGVQAHDALVALARASYDALVTYETERGAPPPVPTPTAERVTRWRGQLDDLRVQAALAEMEVRETTREVLDLTERSFTLVEQKLAAAGREVGAAVDALRKDLQRAGRP